jgi:N-methylhydantoinase A
MYRFAEGSGMPLTIPSIDMIEIGAGGGSIASVDNLGLLKVGPRSAGSEPGPACYGRGGTDATVTDADLVLGLLDADNFLGGEMPLDRPAAEAAVDRLAARLGTSREQAAAGIFRIVAETMAGAARAHATDRGVDHRGLPLLAFGGAGPVHACAVGELLQSTAVIFPPQASVLSAFGSLVTPVRLDLVRSALNELESLDWEEVDRLVGEMTAEAGEALIEAGATAEEIRWTLGADLRYAGQQNEVGIVFDRDPRQDREIDAIRSTFEAAYFAQYGVNPSHVPVEVVSWRLTARGPDNIIDAAPGGAKTPGSPKGERTIPLWSGSTSAQRYDRAELCEGQTISGPALIEERETTVVLPPGWRATMDAIGCITARRSR